MTDKECISGLEVLKQIPHAKNFVEHIDTAIKSIEALDKLDSIIVEQLDNSTDFKECMTLRWVLDKISEVIFEDAVFNVIDSEVFENNELLSPDERADVLNAINDMLKEKGFDLEVGGYEDTDGVFFDVMLMRR